MNLVYGTPQNRSLEWVQGTDLDDLIFPLGGWDVVDGAGGTDTVVVAANASAFRLVQEDSATYVDTISAASDFGGRVQLINVEKIQFTDQLVSLEMARRWAGQAGDDEYLGGAAQDWLVLDGPRDQYSLESVGSGWRVSDGLGFSGADRLQSVERIRFADGVLLLPEQTWLTQQNDASFSDLPLGLYQFFVVAFGAAPGVTFMGQLGQAHRYGMSLLDIVEVFTTKKQFTDLYPASLSTEALARQLMARIVKNSADDAAIEDAVQDIQAALGIGWSLGKVIYTVFGNLAAKRLDDPTWGATAQLFKNQVEVSRYVTDTLHLDTTDLGVLRQCLQDVDAHSDTHTSQAMAQLVGMALDAHGLRDVFDGHTPWLDLG